MRYDEGSDRPLIVVPVVRCRALIGHTKLILPPPVLRPELDGQHDRRTPLVRRQQDLIRRVVNASVETDQPAPPMALPKPVVKPPGPTDMPVLPDPRSDRVSSGRYAALVGASLTLLAVVGVAWVWFGYPAVTAWR